MEKEEGRKRTASVAMGTYHRLLMVVGFASRNGIE